MRLVVVLALAGCEWGGGTDATGDLKVPDAKTADARRADAAIDGKPDGTAANPHHLLLTEVTLAGAGAEFVEIFNPDTQAVDLSHYYLSDNGSYYTLPVAVPAVSFGDFIAQFPAASTIPASGVITIALSSAAAFNGVYGVMPTYSIADATMTITASNNTPSLTDGGEIVVLFYWDGTNALVKDVDVMLAGVPTAANGLVSKSGVAQLGSTYAVDAETIANQAAAPAASTSTKRIAAEAGHETQAGTGNGITGDDETSEDTATTWDAAFSAPTPGAVPAL